MSTAPEPLFLRIHSATYRFGVRWKGAEPLTVGRGGENRIVLSDDGISAHHLRLDRDAHGIVVTDLNSRNGTRVGTVPLHGSTTIVPGQTIELARQVWLTPLRALASGAQKLGWALRLDQRPGLLPIREGRRSLSDLIPGLPESTAIDVEAGRRLLLHRPEGVQEVSSGDVLTVGACQLTFVRQGNLHTTPTHAAAEPEPWQLTVSGANTRPSVLLRSATTEASCWFRPAHPATLLMLLAARHQEAAPSPGWTWDDDLRVGLWGRGGLAADPNNLNVVLYRIRHRLKLCGIDPDILHKQPNRTRLQHCQVRFEDSTG